jgi:hypothetical protein
VVQLESDKEKHPNPWQCTVEDPPPIANSARVAASPNAIVPYPTLFTPIAQTVLDSMAWIVRGQLPFFFHLAPY